MGTGAESQPPDGDPAGGRRVTSLTAAGAGYCDFLSPKLREIADPDIRERITELVTLDGLRNGLRACDSTGEVVTSVLECARERTGAPWAAVLLRDAGEALAPAGQSGSPPPGWEEIRWDPVVDPSSRNEGGTPSGNEVTVPIRDRGERLGVLVLGGPHPGASDAFLKGLAAAAAAELSHRRKDDELRARNRRLALNVYQLQSLMDLTAGLHRATGEAQVWDLLLHGAMGHVLASRAVVVAGGRVLASKGPRRSEIEGALLLRAAEALEKHPGVTAAEDAGEPEMVEALERLRFGAVVPFSGSGMRGVLFVGDPGLGRSLSDDDRALLASLAAQAVAVVEALRLTRSVIEKEKEQKLARSIHARFLPGKPPRLPGWDVWGINIPCLAVGGDHYDYLELPGGLFLSISDVSGKGTGPAIIMASVTASLRAFFTHGGRDLRDAALELNRFLHDNTEANRYMTGVFALLEPESGLLHYVNAGHVRPMLVRNDDSMDELANGSTVLGLFPEIRVEAESLEVAPGDVLALFTDGLSEAEDPAGRQFENRILAVLRESRGRSSREICGELVSRARAFAGSNPLADDLTVLVVRRKGA